MNKKNALLSVYDKTDIAEFAAELVKLGWNIFSSGGTAKVLSENDVPVTDVAELVGGEAILGHRVVTLSREVHAGLLARADVEEDLAELEALGIPFIDLVCVDLYPLEEEIRSPTATPESVIEKTDIGGPTMLRSAAKGRRIVISSSMQRQSVLKLLKVRGELDDKYVRNGLAATAEFVTSGYSLSSARYTSGGRYDGLLGERVRECDYGENRWQSPAALFASGEEDLLAAYRFRVVDGRNPSFINWTDVDRSLQTAMHLVAGHELNFGEVPLVAIAVKHGNACGAAVGDDPASVLQKMVMGDPQAVYGAVMMTNFSITAELADLLRNYRAEGPRLLDGVCAPDIEERAYSLLARRDGKYALMVNPALGQLDADALDQAPLFRQVRGGFLRQPNYTHVFDLSAVERVGRAWTERQLRDAVTGWAIGSTTNSNTTTLVRRGQLIGNGAGQQDRVGSCELALKLAHKAGHGTAQPKVTFDENGDPQINYFVKGAVAYTDSFFPFPDGPELLAAADVAGILASSGSRKDDETRAVCRRTRTKLLMVPDAKGRGFYRH